MEFYNIEENIKNIENILNKKNTLITECEKRSCCLEMRIILEKIAFRKIEFYKEFCGKEFLEKTYQVNKLFKYALSRFPFQNTFPIMCFKPNGSEEEIIIDNERGICCSKKDYIKDDNFIRAKITNKKKALSKNKEINIGELYEELGKYLHAPQPFLKNNINLKIDFVRKTFALIKENLLILDGVKTKEPIDITCPFCNKKTLLNGIELKNHYQNKKNKDYSFEYECLNSECKSHFFINRSLEIRANTLSIQCPCCNNNGAYVNNSMTEIRENLKKSLDTNKCDFFERLQYPLTAICEKCKKEITFYYGLGFDFNYNVIFQKLNEVKELFNLLKEETIDKNDKKIKKIKNEINKKILNLFSIDFVDEIITTEQ